VNPQVRRALVALSLFLAALPLALGKPGLPPNLKADESAYYLMAVSLARDGDVRLTPTDVEHAFDEFPFAPIQNMIVMTDDGWRTVYFGKPWLYSLLATPLVAAFGANGMLLFNMLLMIGMIWLGFGYLRRYNPDGLAALFSVAFFGASAAFAYVFWLQPEVLNMAGVAAALFLGLAPGGRGRRDLWWAALSGAALCVPVYNKPVFAALGLAVVWAYVRDRRWRALGSWLAGAALTMALFAGIGVLLTGHPSSYLGVVRRAVTLCEPGQMPIAPPPPVAAGAPAAAAPLSNAWSWLFRVPDVPLRAFSENLGYFFWGRHTGLLLYLPFAALAFAFFAAHGRRDGPRWVLAASIAVVALFFLVFVPSNWHGGGGFMGNRYFVSCYPAFLFLVTRLAPSWPLLAGAAAGGFLIGPILLTPFGPVGPEPTLQSHVRNLPFRLFPLELSLKHVPGYHRYDVGPVTMVGRRDVFLPRGGGAVWVRGAGSTEILLLSPKPVERAALLVDNPAAGNAIRLGMGGDERRLDAVAGAQQVVLTPDGPDRIRHPRGGDPVFVYRLLVETETGRVRPWDLELPPSACPYFPRDTSNREGFFVGAAITYLGAPDALEQDVFAARWVRTTLPQQATAGTTFEVPVRLVNDSEVTWPVEGGARVELAYHWRRLNGEVVLWDGARTPLTSAVPPGATARSSMKVTAPAEPGRYVLELDPVFENVAWFSERQPGGLLRGEVEVVAPP
jgi:hypothetical protein